MEAEEAKKRSLERTLEAVSKYYDYLKSKTDREIEIEESEEYADNDYKIKLGGNIVAYLEIKCRDVDFATYKYTMIPIRKHGVAEHYFKANNIRTYYLAYFRDGTLATKDITQEPEEVKAQVGRYDRSLTNKDVYAFYELSKFNIIEKGKYAN